MYPFYVKETFDFNYYKVISATEGLKVGPNIIEIAPKEIHKIVNWEKKGRPLYIDLVKITSDQFYEQFTVVQKEINKNLIFKK
jgi:hypothetical protein